MTRPPRPLPQRPTPLSIALISEHASPLGAVGGVDAGGQNIYVAQVARRLAARGHRVDVFTRRDDARLPRCVEVDGYRVVHVDAGPAVFLRKEEMLPVMPAFTEEVAAFAMEHGPYDLTHANFWMSGMVSAELKRRYGIPFLITFHALGKVRRHYQGDADQFPEERGLIEESLVAGADRVIAECPQDEVDLVTLYGADPARIAVVPCGYDEEECQPVDPGEARERLGLPSDAPVILQLGRMVPRKGVDTVVEAVARLRDELPEVRLAVVGGDTDAPDPEATPELGRLSQLARALGADDVCLFTGRRPREEIRYWYSAADVFVTTPWYEPFGITPVEAMACGTPVIGSRVGGIQYTVDEGRTGLLVPPRDPGALAESLRYLLTQDDVREDFSRQARERASLLFTWDRVTAMLEDSYVAVLRSAVAP